MFAHLFAGLVFIKDTYTHMPVSQPSYQPGLINRYLHPAVNTVGPHRAYATFSATVSITPERYDSSLDADILEKFDWIKKIQIKPRVFQYQYEDRKFEIKDREENEKHGITEAKDQRNLIQEVRERISLGKLAAKIEHERRDVARQYLPKKIRNQLWFYRYAVQLRTLPNGKRGYSNYWIDRLRNGKEIANSVLIQMEGPPSIKQAQAFVTGTKSHYEWNKAKIEVLRDKAQIEEVLKSDSLKKLDLGIWLPNFAKRWVGRILLIQSRIQTQKAINKYESLSALLGNVSLIDKALFKTEISAIKKKFKELHPNKTLTVGEPIRSGSMAQAFLAHDSDEQQYIVKIIRPEATAEKLADYKLYQYYQNLIEYGADTPEKRYRAAKDADYMIKILQYEAALNEEEINRNRAEEDFNEYKIDKYNLYEIETALPAIIKNGKTTQRSVLLSKMAGDLTLNDISPDHQQQQALLEEKLKLKKEYTTHLLKNKDQEKLKEIEQKLLNIDTQLFLAHQKIADILPQRFLSHILGNTKQLDDTLANYTIQSDGSNSKPPKADAQSAITSIDWGRSAQMNTQRYTGLKDMMKHYLLMRTVDKPIDVKTLLENKKFREALRNYLTLPSGIQHPLFQAVQDFETALTSSAPTKDSTQNTAIQKLTPLITFLLTQDKTNQRFRFPSIMLLNNLPPLEGSPVSSLDTTTTSPAVKADRPALLDVFYNELIFNLIPNNPHATPDNNMTDQLITNIPIPFLAVKESRNKLRGMFGEAFICPYDKSHPAQQVSDEILMNGFNQTTWGQKTQLAEITTQLHYQELFGELNMDLPTIPEQTYKDIPILLNNMLKAMSTNDDDAFNRIRDELMGKKFQKDPNKFTAICNIYATLLSLFPLIDQHLYDVAHQLTEQWLKDDNTISDQERERFEKNVAHAICYDLQDEIFAAGRAKILVYINQLKKEK